MSNWIPNSFQLPNIFVDEGVKNLSPTACVLYVVIVRKTRGWQKNKDAISLTQFESITGMSRKTVIRGLDELVSCNFVKEYTSKIRGSTKSYALNDSVFSTLLENEVVENLHQSSGEIPPVTSGKIPHTKTTIKTTLKNKGVYSEEFEKFWEAYPRCKRKADKTGTSKTFKKYQHEFDLDVLISILEKQKMDNSWIKENGEFIPAPTVWLNQKQWENDYWLNVKKEADVTQLSTPKQPQRQYKPKPKKYLEMEL